MSVLRDLAAEIGRTVRWLESPFEKSVFNLGPVWRRAVPHLLFVFGALVMAFSAVLFANLLMNPTNAPPGVALMLQLATGAVFFAGLLCMLRIGAEIIAAILGALVAGSFGLELAYLSAFLPTDEIDVYSVLGPTFIVGGLALTFLALRGGFRSARAQIAPEPVAQP